MRMNWCLLCILPRNNVQGAYFLQAIVRSRLLRSCDTIVRRISRRISDVCANDWQHGIMTDCFVMLVLRDLRPFFAYMQVFNIASYDTVALPLKLVHRSPQCPGPT